MANPVHFGLSHFLANGDIADLAPLAVLALLSVACWSIVVLKTAQMVLLRRSGNRFLKSCAEAGCLSVVERALTSHGPKDPWSRLASKGLAAYLRLSRLSPAEAAGLGAPDQFLTRVLRRAITCESLELESGLTLLAITASAAPFVGLFGTVWGIYHALMAIGESGQSSLTQVAGPVGEALVMTAFGLATALPATLAYNLFVRANRRLLSDLDGFAHDLFVLLGGASSAPQGLSALREQRSA